MATVGRITAPTVRETPMPDARITARADPNASAGLVQGLQSVGGLVEKIAEREAEKANTAQLLEARRKLSDWQRTWFDPNNEKGVYARKGRDALGLVDEIGPDFERVASELAQGLRSPQARAQFDAFATAQRDSILDRVNGYAVREHDAYVESEFKANVASAADLAATAAMEGRSEDLSRHTAEGLQVIRAHAKLQGEPAEFTVRKEAEFLSGIHTGTVTAHLVSGNVGAATAHMAEFGDEMTAEARLDVLSKMAPMMVDAMVEDTVSALSGGGPVPLGALPAAGAATSLAQAEAIGAASAGRTVGLESSGDPKATNPRSSAAGLGQFIDATWYRMLAKHRPELVAGVPPPTRGRKLPDHIAELKLDGELSRLMTIEYGKENARYLFEAGLPVTEETVYLAHRFGPEGASRVLSAPPETQVASLVPAAWLRANPDLKGKTVADLSASHARRAGEDAPAAPGRAPGQSVPDALRARADATPNVHLRKALRDRAERLELEAERAERLHEREMTDGIWEAVGNGRPLTPEQRQFARDNRMEGSIEAERKRQIEGTLVQTNVVLYETLMIQALDNPSGFAQLNLGKYHDQLSPSDRAYFTKLQQDVQKPEKQAQLVSDAARVERMAMVLGEQEDAAAKQLGEPDGRAILRHAWIQAKEAFVAQQQREPTPAEEDRLAGEVQRQFLADPKGKAKRTQSALLHNVSGADHLRVRARLRASLGQEPTEEQVESTLAALYRKQSGGAGGD